MYLMKVASDIQDMRLQLHLLFSVRLQVGPKWSFVYVYRTHGNEIRSYIIQYELNFKVTGKKSYHYSKISGL